MKIPNTTLETCHGTLTLLPESKHTNLNDATKISIKRVHIKKEEIDVDYEVDDVNRIISKYGEDRFCLVNFEVGLAPEYIQQVLDNGIVINDVVYHFFGHSSSQIRQRYVIIT